MKQLTRPRGVEQLSNLINKGAFGSAVDVMEPTQASACAQNSAAPNNKKKIVRACCPRVRNASP